jgi:hypothetical protein
LSVRFNARSTLFRKDGAFGGRIVTDKRDHPHGDQGHHSLHLQATEPGSSHLSHWPPPQRGREVRTVQQAKLQHQSGEVDPHPKPHGLGLTRSMFKDDD